VEPEARRHCQRRAAWMHPSSPEKLHQTKLYMFAQQRTSTFI
jgi:hypothetical protein